MHFLVFTDAKSLSPKFVRGLRNRLKLYIDGFEYTKSYHGHKNIKWVCAKKNSLSCKSRVALGIDKNVTVLNGNHNHDRVEYATPPAFLEITKKDLEQMSMEAEELKNKGTCKATSSAVSDNYSELETVSRKRKKR